MKIFFLCGSFMPTFMLLSAEIINLHHQLSVMNDAPTMKVRYRSEPGYTSLAWHPKHARFIAAIRGKIGSAQDEITFNAHDVRLLDVDGKFEMIKKISLDAHLYVLTKLLWSPDGQFLAINSGWGVGKPTIFSCSISDRGRFNFLLENVIKSDTKPQYNFVPQFWLRTRRQSHTHDEWLSVYGLSGDAFEYQSEKTGWVYQRNAMMQHEQKLTTIQYSVCNDRHVFGSVYSLPKAQIAFDFLMITADKGDVVAQHNLCGGILCADITTDAKGFYILAYIPQSNPKEVRIQRMDGNGQLIGSPYILKNDVAITCVWKKLSQNLIVGELKGLSPKITWYKYDAGKGILIREFSRTIARPTKRSVYYKLERSNDDSGIDILTRTVSQTIAEISVIKLLPNYDGHFFAVYFNDTSFDIYDMPDPQWD